MDIKKIVVIDDDVRVIKSIKAGFPDFKIIEFNTGEDGLAYLNQPHSINIVLLDFMLPHIDGISVLTEIKKSKRNIHVILMTGYGTKEVMLEALRNHADDFIEKPVQMPELRKKIDSIMRKNLRAFNSRNEKDKQISYIKEFIRNNYNAVNLNAIANELALSPKYVSRLFIKKNTSNFRTYKLQLKIENAKSLLSKTPLNINEISTKLGYQNPESFMRIFKRITDMTPTQYRKLHGESN